MSLNRSEQMVFDYLQTHPEERQYWVEKVQRTSAAHRDEHAAAFELGGELWRYYEERSAVVSPFREDAARHGGHRMSMRNLAEYLLRLWAPPRRKSPAVRPPQ